MTISLLVPFHVERQVIGPGEAPLTLNTLEWLDSSVLAQVSGQLV